MADHLQGGPGNHLGTTGTTPYLRCQRCGQPLYPLGSCATLAKQISLKADDGLRALDRMRLAIPSSIPAALQESRLDGAILARRLACHAGTCPTLPKTTSNEGNSAK